MRSTHCGYHFTSIFMNFTLDLRTKTFDNNQFYSLLSLQDIEDDSEEQIDKILDAAEACLLICNLYSTTKDVKFLQEDNMDKIVKFAQLQMRETIFPTFDPVFSLRSTKKPDGRKKNKTNNVNNNHGVNVSRKVQLLYNKLVELTRIFVTLFDKCMFIDTIVLAVSTLAVEPFFVDNIEAMQFACLELITTVNQNANTYIWHACVCVWQINRKCSNQNLLVSHFLFCRYSAKRAM